MNTERKSKGCLFLMQDLMNKGLHIGNIFLIDNAHPSPVPGFVQGKSVNVFQLSVEIIPIAINVCLKDTKRRKFQYFPQKVGFICWRRRSATHTTSGFR